MISRIVFAPIVACRFGRQAACLEGFYALDGSGVLPPCSKCAADLTRRDAGLIWPLLPNPEMCNGKTSGQATLVSIQYARKPRKGEEPVNPYPCLACA